MTRRIDSTIALSLVAFSLLSFPSPLAAQSSPGVIDLIAMAKTNEAVAGQWSKSSSGLRTTAATSSRIPLSVSVPRQYDLITEFTRNSGVHSIALILPVGRGQTTFEVDAWGQHLAGFQSIAGNDLRAYPDRGQRVTLRNGQRYEIVVQVREGAIRGMLDGKEIMRHQTDGSDLSVVSAWRLSQSGAIGIGAYQADTTFHRIELRPVGTSAPLPLASNNPGKMTKPPAPRRTDLSGSANSGTLKTNRQATVLLVIANHHFFYREYADPREELMRAGHRVVVAAGARSDCYPHQGSGQTGSGRVTPDIALSEVNPTDFDAIVFSGGWGSSMYQYAFQGRYNDSQYNGNRQTKEVVNRLLTEFHRQDKYIGGICHGHSVLAWSRVDGHSLLRGRRVTAPTISGPAGIYNGQRAQPPSRWNAQQNGANLTAPGSLGDPQTARDDVVVDGKILTAENDRSARHFGVVLARLLSQ